MILLQYPDTFVSIFTELAQLDKFSANAAIFPFGKQFLTFCL